MLDLDLRRQVAVAVDVAAVAGTCKQPNMDCFAVGVAVAAA